MKSKSIWAVFLFVLLLMGLLLFVAFAFIKWVLLGISGLDEKTAAAIIAACATVFASVLTVVYTQQKTNSREINNSHRPQKVEVYKRFMSEVIVGMLKATKEGRLQCPDFRKNLEDLFLSFTGELIVWGSPEVIRAFSGFRGQGNDSDILYRIDDLLQAMRKDLGNSNWALGRGDLIKLFISDPENLDDLLRQTTASSQDSQRQSTSQTINSVTVS